jgi:ADP-heptose:LPS heptosyltransferase
MGHLYKLTLPPPLNPKEYSKIMNKVLIIRRIGGLGDILMHRMMFEDFKRILPGCHLTFACPKKFHDVVLDHPFLDAVIDSESITINEYAVIYDTTSACARYEIAMAPFSGKNRSDIWANHCGIELKKHKMYIKIDENLLCNVKKQISILNPTQKPTVLFTPISAMLNKNLTSKHIKDIVVELRNRGLFVYSTHTGLIVEFQELNVPILQGDLKEWMTYVAAADYVVSVDTSVFHLAGGLSKPLTGIFTFTDGKVYGLHYDFVLVQKHRDNKNWDCGPCYNWTKCPKSNKNLKPCLTELTNNDILIGIDKMLEK